MLWKSAAAVIAGFIVHPILTMDWAEAIPFSCLASLDNACSSAQHAGYDWKGLIAGSFSSYGSNTFSGLRYINSQRRYMLSGRLRFQGLMVTSNLDDTPSMSSSNNHSFSISQTRIASFEEAEIDCHDGMPDVSICKGSYDCSPGRSTFDNKQCGGKSVRNLCTSNLRAMRSSSLSGVRRTRQSQRRAKKSHHYRCKERNIQAWKKRSTSVLHRYSSNTCGLCSFSGSRKCVLCHDVMQSQTTTFKAK